MNESLTILTVCLGNICRSPTAEAALRAAGERQGVPVQVSSVGTSDWHIDEPAHPPMRAAATDAGLELIGRATQIDAAAVRRADLVVAMDRNNLAETRRLAEMHELDTPIVLFRRFDPDADDAEAEVPDPYGGVRADYDEVVAICQRTAEELIARVARDGLVVALHDQPA